MSASIVSHKSTTVRSLISTEALLRGYFGVVSRVLPDLARRQAERLFSAPPRVRSRRPAKPVDAREERVRSGRHSLAVWQTGPRDGPRVLLVHGWGGRGDQLSAFIAPLVARGYGVVWFDHPGHGDSGRGPSSLPDFARAVTTLAATHGPFTAAIGHSLGAAALGIALRGGLDLGRVVFVGAPASITEHAHRFARMLGITPRIREAMRVQVERRFGMRFADIDSIDELSRLRLPALFIHDRGDQEVPFDDAARLAARMPGATLLTTHGFGHRRILRDEAVVDAAVRFAVGDGANLPEQLPVLPRPAPIY